MNATRIAGFTSLTAGLLLVLLIALSSILGPSAFAGSAAWSMGAWPMGAGPIGAGHMSGGMGPGMMGFGSTGQAAPAIPGAAEVNVQAANFSFSPSEIHLPKGSAVNLTLSNPAGTGVVHDLTVPALGIHIVADPGRSATVGLSGLAAGRYDAFCGVPGHADLGMRATVIVG